MNKLSNKDKQSAPEYILVDLTFVPKNSMVMPKTVTAKIKLESITSAIINQMLSNHKIKQALRNGS